MSAPHHHVFNAMQREIYHKLEVDPLLPILKERGVISSEQDKLFKKDSKKNIKILVGILRNQSFETFLGFVECICIAHESPEGEGKVEKPIVVSIRNVVEDFDSNHNTEYVKRIDEIIDHYKKTATFLEQTAEEEHTTLGEQETVSSAEGATASLVPAMASLDISESTGDDLPLPVLPYISKPMMWSFTSIGGDCYDENLDLYLCVPPGTVLGGEQLKLKVGACCYGPFSIPERYFVVTAFYCIVASQKLQKPVTVEMGHCLLLPEYQKSRSVCVLKADHYTVSTSDRHSFEFLTHPNIANDRPYLSFEIRDFCILCGVVEAKPEEQSSQLVTTTNVATDQPSMMSDEGHVATESEQSSLDQLPDTDKDIGGRRASSDKQHSGTATVPQRHQLKRQHSIECDSPAKRHCRAEYAILLFEPQNISSSPFSFFFFICQFCKVAIEECMKQAEETIGHRQPSILQVEFEGSEIKFVISDVHIVEIKAKMTPVVKETQVHQIHADIEQLRGLTEMKVYPPRVEFQVYHHHCLKDATHCEVKVQGAICSDSTPAYFSVTIPGGDRSLLQLQHQVSQELDQYLSQLTDEKKDKEVSEQILARASCFITERWKMTGRFLRLTEVDISKISHDYSQYGVEECAYQSLLKWKKQSLDMQNTTVEELIKILYKSREYEAIDKMILFLKNNTSLEHGKYLSQLTDEEKDKQVSEQILARASIYMTGRWRMTGRFLGLTEVDISKFFHDYSQDGVEECAYQSLLKWKKQSLTVQNTTVRELIKVLHESREHEAINKIILFLHSSATF